MTITVIFKRTEFDILGSPMKRMYENVDRYEIRDGLLILTKRGEKSVAIIPMDNVLYIGIEWDDEHGEAV